MAKTDSRTNKTRGKPATTIEGRENQLINLAVDLAEKQLRDGTASPSVITHYLKMGSVREQKERMKLEEENKLLRAKTEALESEKDVKTLYQEALESFRVYSGQKNVVIDD